MKKIFLTTLWACFFCQLPCFAQAAKRSAPSTIANQSADLHGKPITLVGYVRDAFCLMKNPEAGEANDKESRTCMRQCIQGGSPLVVLGDDRKVYLPIAAGEPPDKNERQRLLPFAGEMVRITGLTFDRGEMHAIAINKIEVLDRK